MNHLNLMIVGAPLPDVIADHGQFRECRGPYRWYTFPIAHLTPSMVRMAAAHWPLAEDDTVIAASISIRGIEQIGTIALSERALEALIRIKEIRVVA